MFERFTDRARRVVVLAQEEARLLGHSYIGTEHVLLGLIHEQEGVAARVLDQLGISLDSVRAKVESIIGQGDDALRGHIPFTPRAKKVLELSLREALALGHNYIGTEHILLGLVREGEGVGAQVLVNLGADLWVVRETVIQQLSGVSRRRASWGGPVTFDQPRLTPAAAKAGLEARRLAGPRPVGSHHYLLALLDQTDSMAAKALAGLGVTRATVEEQLKDRHPAGTSDETPEEAGARRIRLRVQDKVLTLEIDDPELAASLEQAMVGRKARIITGTDPEAEEAGFSNLWSAVSRTVDDLTRRLGRMTTTRAPGRPTATGGEWRPPGWHEGGHVAVYWVVSSGGGGKATHLQCSDTDPAPVRAWLRDWLTENRPRMAGADPGGGAHCCSAWAYVDRAGDSFTMASFGSGQEGPPGSEPVPLDELVDHALADLA